MKTIEISNAAYNRIMSKRRGDESLSTVILREIKKGKKQMSLRDELDMIKKEGTYYPIDEVYNRLCVKK
ncbi:hypothetical protein [Methanomicrobium mobile]|uniref:hypothetical protein n=1 Tax=Methanomicrobium mobile TaxID=2205 RepID=UPI0005B25F78|nr:hypothetical protein [Methanomicrobium mobile]